MKYRINYSKVISQANYISDNASQLSSQIKALEQIEQDGKYNLESSLVYIASRLKSDEHRALVEKFGVDEEKIYSRGEIIGRRNPQASCRCGRQT